MGGAAACTSSAAHAQLPFPLPSTGLSLKSLFKGARLPEQVTNPETDGRAGRQYFGPAGYTARFLPLRAMLGEGDLPNAIVAFQQGGVANSLPNITDPEAAQHLGTATQPGAGKNGDNGQTLNKPNDVFLANCELGHMRFEQGDYGASLTHLRAAEAYTAEQKRAKSKGLLGQVGQTAKDVAGGTIGVLTGKGDFGPYRQRDYEEVIALNYIALGYLLQGDRRAYNVTRRANVRQNELLEAFSAEIQVAEEKARTGTKNSKAKFDLVSVLLGEEFARYTKVSESVPSSYVNPIGSYLSGVIQEIVSFEQPSLRTNARIAFENAKRLARNSRQLQAMSDAMGQPAVEGQRIVHILVSEGFAPSRQMLRYGLQSSEGEVTSIRLGIFEPTESVIDRMELSFTGQTRAGREIAVNSTALDPLGDFEALIQRSQSERQASIFWDVVAATFRDDFISPYSKLAQEYIGVSLDSVPDLRSWNSLPRRAHIARVSVPVGAREIELVSRAANGSVLAKTRLPLQADLRQTFVYARAHGRKLFADAPRRLWIDGTLTDDDSVLTPSTKG